ncbi:MAG TPA: alpha/beta hydrolase [Polyangiales bacterium]|nr:alpha/beta hydrolase [Polyangiales bacterium]
MEELPRARERSIWTHGFGAATVLLTLTLLMALAGMMYETIARRYARLNIAAPGELIDLGGRRIHLDCRGRGSPTVVLESGHDVLGSLSWTRVHGPLARITRVCTYDRAGYLWSDEQHARRDAVGIAVELRAVLNRANEKGPYVVVAHGQGGLYALAFTALMKNSVRGLVLVDAVHPDLEKEFAKALGSGEELPFWLRARNRIRRALGPFWATVGVTRLEGVELPPDVDEASARIAHAFTPSSREAIWSEESGFTATLREVGAVRNLGDRYLTVLTALPPPSASAPDHDNLARETWLGLQRDMTSWSTRSHQELVLGARHHIQLSKPAAVIDAVEAIVIAVGE